MPPQNRRFCANQNLPHYSAPDRHLASVVQEYLMLSQQDIPSTTAANRLDEILALAETDPVLHRRLVAIDEAVCRRQNLLTCLQQEQYRDTLAHVGEFIDLDSFKHFEDTQAWRTEERCLRDRIDSLQS